MLVHFLLPFLIGAQDHEKAIDAAFAQYAGLDRPGVAVALFKDGKIVFEKGYGAADLANKTPIRPDSLFEIQSTTKQFTAACIALLVKEGKLRWSDDVRRYVPELKSWGPKISLDHLAHHTSGLKDCTFLLELLGRDMNTTFSEMLKTVNATGPNFKPGALYSYSNTNYILLAEVVSRVSGMQFARFAKSRIFQPLGMEKTQFQAPLSQQVVGYVPSETGFTPHQPVEPVAGHGGLWTSVHDLAKWDEEFYAGPVLGKDVMDSLLVPGKLNNGYQTTYARGLMIGSLRRLPNYRHDGGDAHFSAELVRVPSLHASVAVLANRGDVNPTALAGTAFMEFFGDLVPAPAGAASIEVPEAEREGFAGFYREKPGSKVWQIEPTEEGLFMRSIEEGGAEVKPVSPGRYAATRKEFNLEVRKGYLLRRFGKQQLRLERLAPPKSANLESWTGSYIGIDLPIRLEVEVEKGALRLRVPAVTDWQTLAQASPSQFMGESLSLRRGRDGVLFLSHMRALNLRFQKR